MNPQSYIAGFYSKPHILSSVRELGRFRKSNILHIIGNGPSAYHEIRRLSEGSSRADVSGSSALAFLDLEIDFFFFEPEELVNQSLGPLEDPLEIAKERLFYCMHMLQIEILNNRSDINCIIANPQFPKNEYGFTRLVSEHDIYIPPWYFINEKNFFTKAHGLRSYFQNSQAKQNLLLNFCGSIIRQLSLGCILGYEEINVYGIEPSLPSYWYTSRIAEISMLLERSHYTFAMSLFKALEKLEKEGSGFIKNANCFWGNNEWLGFTRSILVCARYFSRHFSRTAIRFHTDDPILTNMAEELLAKELVVKTLQA